MQDEREYLIKHIFPELRAICRDRGVEFTEIDLRWGVTEEEAQQGKVVKICLEEIDRCRPYFIGILGERYGWTPNKQDVQKDTDLLTTYPWINDCIEKGISVTEMEVLYGVLNNPRMEDHTYFYFRDPSRTNPEFKETDEQLKAKLTDLKDRIRESSFPVHEDFPDPVKLGELVRNDLLEVINKNFPLDEAPTPLEQQRRAHNAYALTRRKAYVTRPHYIELLDKHAENEEQPLVIIGDSGSGKSSLISYWAHHHRKLHPEAFIITHFVGASSSGAGHLGIIQRIMEEIHERYQLQDEVPATPEALEKEFPNWLAKVQKEPLILILDALDHLPGDSKFLRWLPRHFPPHIRTIISVTRGATFDVLCKNGFPILEIELLNEAERDQLIVGYLGQFRKALSYDQRLAIIEEEKTANPLFLRTLLEELRIFGLFEELDNKIKHYVSSRDLSDLFQRVLARMEGDYGTENLETILGLLWVARRGLSETELLEISGVSRLQLSVLLQALEFQLMRHNGLLDFYHVYLREAAQIRYYNAKGDAEVEITRQARLRIANYFEHIELCPRKAEELPWQLAEAAEIERLKHCLASIPMFLEFAQGEKYYELLGYWRKVGDLAVMENIYADNITFHYATRDDKDEAEAYKALGDFLRQCGRFTSAEPLLRRSLELQELAYGAENPKAAASGFELARLLFFKGAYDESAKIFAHTLEVQQKIFGNEHPETVRSLFHLAQVNYQQGRFAEAEVLYRQALEISRTTLGEEHQDTARIYNNLGHLRKERGDLSESEKLYRNAYQIWERTIGVDHPLTTFAIYNLAHLLHIKGDRGAAEPLFRQALSNWENIFGREHPTTAMGLDSLAIFLRDIGQFEQAEGLYREAIEVWEKLLGKDHLNTATTYNNLAEVLLDEGKFEESEKYYQLSRETFERILGKEHPYTSHPLHGLGLMNMKRGSYHEAATFFRHAYEIREKAYGAHHETLEAMNDLLKALQQTSSDTEIASLQKRKTEIETSVAT
jgi:tetratricopeptide (TPR) repeat protein